jgi:GST-like protein
MIDLYYFPTPNCWKVTIMLEETGLPYRLVPIDITAGEQHQASFLAVNPNNRVPAIIDHDAPGGPQPVFESGAILVYLAEKTGRFLPASGHARITTLEWLFWQMAGLGPIAGQAHHFVRFQPDNRYALERFVNEARRLYGVLDRQLASRDWIADAYSIADMACWGWVWYHGMHHQSLDDFPAIARWFHAMGERTAVRRARAVGLESVSEEIRRMCDAPYWLPPEA